MRGGLTNSAAPLAAILLRARLFRPPGAGALESNVEHAMLWPYKASVSNSLLSMSSRRKIRSERIAKCV